MTPGLRLRALWLGARYGGVVSQRLGGLFAWHLWFTPWAVQISARATQREAQWLAGTQSLRLATPSGALSGFSAGAGPTVLLVHGWGDRASRLGAFVAPLVAQGYRVVGIDLPAHGDSPGRRTNAYEAEAALQAVASQVGPIHAVVAHSMGGAETLLALREGLEVDRVALLAPPLRLRHAMEPFATMFALPGSSMAGLTARIERQFGKQVWDDLSSDRIARMLELPALIVHDTQDTQVSYADAQQLHRAWPGSRFVTTEGLGHARILRDEDVIREVCAFVAARVDAEAS